MPCRGSGFCATPASIVIALFRIPKIALGSAVIIWFGIGEGAECGIGAFMLSAGNLDDTDDLLAGVVVLSLVRLAVS
jgi:ABC-type nitrate/sulfonate/bicarbonate transport system permease component